MNPDFEFSFYHLTVTPLEKALPKILEKIIAAKQRAVIYFNDEKKMEEMNNYLWSFSSLIIIPHGSANDPYHEDQPIYLTNKNENPNKADIKILLHTSYSNIFTGYKRFIYFFDENIEEERNLARERYAELKQQNVKLTYFKQQQNGSWEQL